MIDQLRSASYITIGNGRTGDTMSIIEAQSVAIHLNCVKFVIIITSDHADVYQKRFIESPNYACGTKPIPAATT